MNTVITNDNRIKSACARLFKTPNTENNDNHVFTDKEFTIQFDTNDDGTFYLKNRTFKASPVWETLEDRFIATTANYHYVLFFSQK